MHFVFYLNKNRFLSYKINKINIRIPPTPKFLLRKKNQRKKIEKRNRRSISMKKKIKNYLTQTHTLCRAHIINQQSFYFSRNTPKPMFFQTIILK